MLWEKDGICRPHEPIEGMVTGVIGEDQGPGDRHDPKHALKDRP